MLDIRLFREQPDHVRERLNAREPGLGDQVDAVLAVDAERRRLETELQKLQAERNRLSKEIGALRAKKANSQELEARVRELGERIGDRNAQVTRADERQRSLLLALPNLPHPGAPVGADVSANPVVRVWGEPPRYPFAVSDHVEIAGHLKLI
ncbi:MAG: serine--tRNA ligase, partial [Verrucomicrobia bacterium]|nr:serine--tRNA ligase [Verrucomicrobiota bacterium]